MAKATVFQVAVTIDTETNEAFANIKCNSKAPLHPVTYPVAVVVSKMINILETNPKATLGDLQGIVGEEVSNG